MLVPYLPLTDNKPEMNSYISCDICGKNISTNQLQNHMNSVHQNESVIESVANTVTDVVETTTQK